MKILEVLLVLVLVLVLPVRMVVSKGYNTIWDDENSIPSSSYFFLLLGEGGLTGALALLSYS